jgi:hypothetical protein
MVIFAARQYSCSRRGKLAAKNHGLRKYIGIPPEPGRFRAKTTVYAAQNARIFGVDLRLFVGSGQSYKPCINLTLGGKGTLRYLG